MTWQEVKEDALIACKRYCCMCGAYKGVNIEVHHIIPRERGGPDTFDNAIPLCFDCHSTVGGYNNKHPKGNKYSSRELKHIRDEFYEKVKDMPRKSQCEQSNPQTLSAAIANNVGAVNLWQQLSTNLERYQQVIDYAYESWEGNFKNKYPRIHITDDEFGNQDWQDLQDEIDRYGDNLYHDIFENIGRDYGEAKNVLGESITCLAIELSTELYNKLTEYMNCMTFHYRSDGGVGIVDYYWSSFFVCLDKNYIRMKELKAQIDEKLRLEYRESQCHQRNQNRLMLGTIDPQDWEEIKNILS